MAPETAIGLDIGGTKIAAGIVDRSGRVGTRAVRSTPGHSRIEVEEAVAELVGELHREAPGAPVGIGAAGWMNPDTGTVLFSPHLAWRNEPLRDRLEDRLGARVTVANDADAAGWAEWRFGAGRGESHLVCLTLGTGIGGAVVADGTLRRGRYGLAGEFGHQIMVPGGHRCECGNRGCWEQYASGNALGREGRELARAGSPVAQTLVEAAGGNPDAIDGEVVTRMARGGDPASRELVVEVGEWLGLGMANLAAALDPGMFVIGGGLGAASPLLLEAAEAGYRRHLTGRGYRPFARVARAELGADAGLVGAADLARSDPRRHGGGSDAARVSGVR
ncbi:ROK family protein [Zafaria sp. Z1313]|uniref:ROK family protein n=1 Tax=unclassified Zafaria TaxID=2828765 RepID=UPI002E78A103|nr:ROK family protein [Zafaria sp. J156]MEE1622158.1 ROK family protein [Zafaria sp. J156]